MLKFLPVILRSAVTGACILALFFSLSRPRFKKWAYILTFLLFVAVDVCAVSWLSIQGRNGLAACTGAVLALVMLLPSLALAEGGFMEQVFTAICSLDVSAVYLFATYALGSVLPYADYSTAAVRLILLFPLSVLLRGLVRPVHSRLTAHWPRNIPSALGFLACFIYGLCAAKGAPDGSLLGMLAFLSVAAVLYFFTVYKTCKANFDDTADLEVRLRAEKRRELLSAELSAGQEYFDLLRRARLSSDENIAPLQFCPNPAANAALRIAARRCARSNVTFNAKAEIPEALPLTTPEASAVFGYLLDSACTYCEDYPETGASLSFSAKVVNGSMWLEVRSSVSGRIDFDDGYPCHFGSAADAVNVSRILESHRGMVSYDQKSRWFITRVVLPLK